MRGTPYKLIGLAALAAIASLFVTSSASGQVPSVDIVTRCLDNGAQQFTFTLHNHEGTTITINNDNVTYTGFDSPPPVSQFSPTTVPDGGTSTFVVIHLPPGITGHVTIQVGFGVLGGEGGAISGATDVVACSVVTTTTTTTVPPTDDTPVAPPVGVQPTFTG